MIKNQTPEQVVKSIISSQLEDTLVKNFILCYRRYINSSRLFRLITEGISLIKTLNFLSLWINYHFQRDFWKVKFKGSTRLKFIINLIENTKTRIDFPKGSYDQILSQINGIKLALIRGYKNLHKPKILKTIKENDRLFSHSVFEIGEQLTYLESKIFNQISITELTQKDRPITSLLINRSNEITNWIASLILAQKTPSIGSKVLKKFILIAQACEQLGNYNTVMEILGAFNLWAINRLKNLYTLETKYAVILVYLKNLTSPDNNYANLRKVQEERKKEKLPTLPYLGLFLRDLALVDEANQDLIDGSVNLEKLELLSQIFNNISQYQRLGYKIIPNWDILPNLVSKGWNEEQINTASKALRPFKEEDSTSKDDSDISEFIDLESQSQNLKLLEFI